MRGLTILLAEDEAEAARVMALLMEELGHAIEVCGTVTEAIALIDRRTFDLLITDINLPDGSGLDLIGHVRRTGSRMPAIAATGYGSARDRARYRAAGFDGLLIKPLDSSQLETLLDTVFCAEKA